MSWPPRQLSDHGWTPADVPKRPVLFINPSSGGGKAARAEVTDRARERGVEVVLMTSDRDPAALAREAVARGADVLGVAGGDGSLAVVAAVAAAHGLPFTCIPAGTRNHFARDLGIDRQDLIGALDAFTDGMERRIDLAEVNGRVYVTTSRSGSTATRFGDRRIATRRCERCCSPRRRCSVRARAYRRCISSTIWAANTSVPPSSSCRTIPMHWIHRPRPARARRSTAASWGSSSSTHLGPIDRLAGERGARRVSMWVPLDRYTPGSMARPSI